MLGVVELGIDRVTGATRAMLGTILAFGIGIAALDHESRNDAMESRAVVKPFAGQFFKVVHMAGRLVRKKFEFNVAMYGLYQRNFFTH